jgi:hypothetical protein
MMKLKTLLFVLMAATVPMVVRAEDDVDFSFDGNLSDNNDDTGLLGTVTGELIGLTEVSPGLYLPTDVVITSAPSGFDLTSPLDFGFGSTTPTSVLPANGFTLDNTGNVTGGSLYVDNGTDYLQLSDTGNVAFGISGADGRDVYGVPAYEGFAGVTYDLAPEPKTAGMLALGLTVILGTGWRRMTRRQVA